MKYWVLERQRGFAVSYVKNRGEVTQEIDQAMRFKSKDDARSFSIIYKIDGFAEEDYFFEQNDTGNWTQVEKPVEL